MPVERVETLVIGGGQAGLAMSYRLKQRGLNHLVLERHRIAERWRSERWDGLKFQFPNWSVRVAGLPLSATAEPDAFATAADIVRFHRRLCGFRQAPPIRCGVEVTRLQRRGGGPGFIAETANGSIEAKNVVVATGPYQRALMPDLLRRARGVSGPCQRLPKSRPASAGRGAGGRRRRVGGANRRRTPPRRPPRLSRGRPAHADAAPLPRARSGMVVARAGCISQDAGTARANPGKPRHNRRLWRPHHRFPPLRRRRHHAARKGQGGAQRRTRYCPRSRRVSGERGCRLCDLARPVGRACRTTRPRSARRRRRSGGACGPRPA